MYMYVVVVQLPSCVWFFATPWTAARQASLSVTISWSLPKFMFIALVKPSRDIFMSVVLCYPGSPSSIPAFCIPSSLIHLVIRAAWRLAVSLRYLKDVATTPILQTETGRLWEHVSRPRSHRWWVLQSEHKSRSICLWILLLLQHTDSLKIFTHFLFHELQIKL